MIVETPQAGENAEQVEVRLATVAEVTNDGVRLQFDGSDEATEKVYKCNSSCMFAQGDRVKVTKHSGTYLVDYVIGGPGEAGHGIPSGGSSGQVLAKSSNANYAVTWLTPHYIPSGGNSGQVLAKSSGDDYAVEWIDAAHGIPSGGSSGQVLAKSNNTNYAVSWVDAPHGLPTGGNSGQVLAKSSNTNYAVSWVDVSASKLKSGNYEVALSSTVLTPSASTIALGSSSKPFGDLYAQGNISLGANYKSIAIGTNSSTLGFFGHTAASRQTVANTATVATLITALKAYGLIL